MHSRFRMKGVLLAALVAVLASVAVPNVASAEPQPGVTKKGFRLFARALGAMTINRVYCGLASDGQICVDSTNSSTIGGGFWPKGTPDQYVFNSGLQVAGVIGPDGGPWAGDTTGGFFFDPKGTTQHGQEVMPISNATNTLDLASWPAAACVPRGDSSASLFNTLLQSDATTGATGDGTGIPFCRKSASQGDVWFLSWEGNSSLKAGRQHPLGVAVETRGMGWNFPSGNEDILYFIYTFYNITTPNQADYLAHGVRPSLATILAAQGSAFQASAAAQGTTVPAGGYTINNLFAAFGADMDVGEAGSNYSSVNLPFALGYVYDHIFSDKTKLPQWQYDPSIFGGQFFPGVGFVGVKYLKSPTGAGAIQLFSNTINGQPFAGAVNDPRDVSQLYRYLSGTLSPAQGDQACNTGNPAVTRICFVNNTSPQDMRFFQSSTPLTLAPGEGGSIVVAYIFAAPVKTGSCPSPACDIKPGNATVLTNAGTLASTGANTIDSITGFRGYTDINGDNIATQDEFSVVPGSLLGKSLVAQAVFDGKFLLPFAPAPPDFFLIPGDNQVTVLWKPSASETTGDPFFALASQAQDVLGAANALYDPNYRQNDVEGYRIYRGRVDAPNELTLLAQYDYSGTVITDFTGVVNPVQDCAPELAINAGCPVAFAPNLKNGTQLTNSVDYPLVGEVVQLSVTGPSKGRLALANGNAIIVKSDTAVSGGGTSGGCGPKSVCPKLDDTGVPFVYVDRTIRNNFRYFYSVTAFDVNSIESGPTSLESPRNTKSVTPVKPASNYVNTGTLSTHVVGRGVRQDSVFPTVPNLDATTGKFTGPMPPADGVTLGFVGEFVKQVIAAPGSLSLTLDSIGAGSAYDGAPTTYYMTAGSGGNTVQISVPIVQDVFDAALSGSALFDAVKIDNNLAKLYGGDSSYALKGQASITLAGNYHTNSYGRGCINGATGFDVGGGCDYNGSRWFDGPSPANNETLSNPNAGNDNSGTRTMDRAAANNAGFNNAGELTGVSVVHNTLGYLTTSNSYRQVEGVLGSFKRAADYNVYWSATTAGLIDSVIDVTHNVVVPFDANFLGASYGVLNQAAAATFAGSFDNRAELTLTDFGCIPPLRTFAASAAIIGCTAPQYVLSQQAALGSIAFFTGTATSNAQTSTNTGTGFALYMPGGLYMFQTAALPQGTVWALRDYVGAITGGNGHTGNEGPFAFYSAPRPFSAVGAALSVDFDVTNAVRNATFADLKQVHTVPDPYYVTNEFEQTTDNKVIKFVNLPQRAIIRIYSSSGVLVQILEHNSTTNGGDQTWNVRNRNNQVVASGVYFYHIEANGVSGGSAKRVGRMTIVNFAQ